MHSPPGALSQTPVTQSSSRSHVPPGLERRTALSGTWGEPSGQASARGMPMSDNAWPKSGSTPASGRTAASAGHPSGVNWTSDGLPASWRTSWAATEASGGRESDAVEVSKGSRCVAPGTCGPPSCACPPSGEVGRQLQRSGASGRHSNPDPHPFSGKTAVQCVAFAPTLAAGPGYEEDERDYDAPGCLTPTFEFGWHRPCSTPCRAYLSIPCGLELTKRLDLLTL